ELALCFGHREPDPIGQLEASLLAERVDAMDELVRLALEHELVVEAQVERHRHAVRRGDSPALSPTPLDEHLLGVELVPGHAETALRQLFELPRRERVTNRAQLLPQLR